MLRGYLRVGVETGKALEGSGVDGLEVQHLLDRALLGDNHLVDYTREAHHGGAAMNNLGKFVPGAVLGAGEGKGVEAKVSSLAVGAGEHIRGRDLEPGKNEAHSV